MKKTQDHDLKQTVALAVWGGALIAAILLITTIWVTSSARTGTKEAVSRVSEFYLEEMTGRRARVVAQELNNHFDYMENAIGLLEGSDLISQDALRSFLAKVETLYGVDKFALVDEQGIVYTEHSTVSGLSRYSFLSEEMTKPVISTLNLYGAKKQVILAMPVEDIFFQGSRISACFIQLNIDEMLSSLTLQGNNNETECSLYYRNGESLTDSDDLFRTLANAQIEKGFSYEQLKQDFASGRKGQIAFNYQGNQQELCYMPVENTNWMLTFLIRDNVISSQISSISSEMMHRSDIQIAITVAAMLGVFLVLSYQSRKNSRLLLDQEKADGDRIRAAYVQIEREQRAMDNIHAAMGSGLWSMEFDEKGEMVSCVWSDDFRRMLGYENEEDFPNKLESWSELLHSKDKERVLREYWDTVRDYTGGKTHKVEK